MRRSTVDNKEQSILEGNTVDGKEEGEERGRGDSLLITGSFGVSLYVQRSNKDEPRECGGGVTRGAI